MQVNFNPSIQNNRQQRPAFKAYNDTFFKEAIKNADVIDKKYYFRVLSGEFPIEDYIDTLPNIKKHYAPRYAEAIQDMITWAKKFVAPKK